MTKPEYCCPTCGATTKRYKHHMSKGLAGALAMLYDKFGMKPAKVAELGLTYTQTSNFQKLAYWSLVKRTDGTHWQITDAGRWFVMQSGAIPRAAWSYRGKPCAPPLSEDGGPLDEEIDLVMIEDLLPGYKPAEVYAEEARPKDDGSQPSLFT